MYLYGIYQSQISHHGHLPYFTVHHFGTELCTRLFQIDAWWDIGNVHCGIWGLIYYLSVWLTHWGLKKRLQMIFCKIFVNQPVQKPVIITMTSYSDVSNYQPHNCFLNRLFRRRSKNISKLRVTGLWGGIHRWPVISQHKGPVMQKMFPFDEVIMYAILWLTVWSH